MKYKIILASNSPRRRELLAGLDVNFEVKVLNGIDESYPDDLDAYQVAEFIAQKKAEAYRSLLNEEESSAEESLQQEQNAQGNKQPSPNEEHRGNKAAQTCDKDQDC